MAGENNRVLTRFDSIAISIGVVIGIGIFRVPSDVARYLPFGWLILLAWFTGAIFSLLGALCYAELAAMYPETGGDYVFLRRAYGKLPAFLFAWTELLVIRTGSIAAACYLFSGYACALFSIDSALMKYVAIGIVLILGLINAFGLTVGKRLQNVLSFTKVVTLLIMVIAGFLFGHGSVNNFCVSLHDIPAGSIASAFLLALIPILWTYGGWQESVFVAGETSNPAKTLPIALTAVVLIIGSLYVLVNAALLYLLPPAQLAASVEPAAAMLRLLYGRASSRILEVLVTVYAIGSINAMLITGSRITYAMACDVAVFKTFASATANSATPVKALALNVTGACIFILLGSFERLLFFTGFAVWLFFALVAATLFAFRARHPEVARPFRVPFYPWLPVCFVLGCLSLCANTLWVYTQQSLLGLALICTGVPVFYMSKSFASKKVQ